ncbi:MAG TPA: ABC transporter substrate-binding protein [Syntrophales bacterium]|nr:ABC transporter substrate-binding protein [Syntrophales bacterium]HOL58401.1 ABC transporter substrate-binding protein [Syntrophales bacterium]HPO34570.1 ABC transporter substrate-binding protein [Syntrophales bacterium]
MSFRKTWIAFFVLACFLVFGGPVAADEIVVGFSGPLSGPAAEYGQDILFGVDLAVKEINAAGGITVGGKKYTFRLEKLDDRVDPTQATNNARRFKANGAVAVFNGVFTTIAPLLKINQEKGQEFIVMSYTSTPKVTELGNKLMVNTTVTFTPYVEVFSDWALKKGWKRLGMLVTLGAYGEEWRHTFRDVWTKKGGIVTADKPANYYVETDFSAPITAVLATKPDVLLIGGPSATTALVIEQLRSMGFKGGLIMVDQAKQDYIAQILKGSTIMGDLIGTAGVDSLPGPASVPFEKKFRSAYKRMVTWECALNYDAMHALAKAIAAAGTTTDIYKIRASFPKAFPLLADHYPAECHGINEQGRMFFPCSIQTITKGKRDPSGLYYWWPKTQQEFQKYKNESKIAKGVSHVWLKVAF